MSQHRRSGVLVAVVATVAILLAVLLIQPINHRKDAGKINRIVNNLRHLDGAKQQWALDHNKTGAVEITTVDLAGYPGTQIQPVAEERYVLNPLTMSPVAELTHAVEGKPEGTRIRLGLLTATNWDYEIILPNRGAEPDDTGPRL